MLGFFQNRLDVILSMSMFFVHFAVLGKSMARFLIWLSFVYFIRWCWRCLMGPFQDVQCLPIHLSLCR